MKNWQELDRIYPNSQDNCNNWSQSDPIYKKKKKKTTHPHTRQINKISRKDGNTTQGENNTYGTPTHAAVNSLHHNTTTIA